MFIHKKKNRSGTTSVVIVEKKNGKFKELKTVGISSEESEVEKLTAEGRDWISIQTKGEDIFNHSKRIAEEKQVIEHPVSNIEGILLNGTQVILSRVFNLIGFGSIDDDILKQLVIARLSQPMTLPTFPENPPRIPFLMIPIIICFLGLKNVVCYTSFSCELRCEPKER